jgi:hypothetical protein
MTKLLIKSTIVGLLSPARWQRISLKIWGQSYDRELQRQRCKNLQRREYPHAF